VDPHVETIHRQAELKECHCEKMSPAGFLSFQREAEKSIVHTLILQKYSRIMEVDHSKCVPLDETWEIGSVNRLTGGIAVRPTTPGGVH